MIDRREAILSRLFAILTAAVTEPAITTVYRNRGEIPDLRRPALVMLDADETPDTRERNRGRPASSPNLVMMEPEIFLLVGDKPGNEVIGQQLNAMRIVILRDIMTDVQLSELVGPNGEIRYNGLLTDLATGRGMQGEMKIGFLFTYVLHPAELV